MMEPMQAFGWSLLHFLWQGAVIGASLALALTALRRATAQARYVASCVALVLCLLAPIVTFGVLTSGNTPHVSTVTRASADAADSGSRVAPKNAGAPVSASARSTGPTWWDSQRVRATLEAALPAIVALWGAGALLCSLRFGGGWLRARHLRQRAIDEVPARLGQSLARLVDELGVRRAVRLVQSARVRVPTVVGWMRPVVIVPARALTGMTEEQLVAILAHELAHIRRHDYAVNVLQNVVEALLFYHPAVWWVSKQIRRERENCCDDVAVESCGSALTYAHALTALETSRVVPSPALAANGGSLLRRIRRLAREDDHPQRNLAAPMMVAFVLLVTGSLVATQSAAGPKSDPEHGSANWTGVRHSESDGEILFQVKDRDRGLWLEAEYRGDVTLDADLRTIESVSIGGHVRIRERSPQHERELRVTPGTAQPDFAYFVDGAAAPFDSQGGVWLAGILPELMRRGGLGAEAHARRLLDTGGPQAVLEEIDLVESNAVLGIFYRTLLVHGDLDESQVLELVRRAGQDIDSNSTFASLLLDLVRHDRLDGEQALDIAGEVLTSNSVLASLIRNLLDASAISPLQALRTADERIDSDSTRATLLQRIAATHGDDPLVRDAVLESLLRFSSNSTLASLITSLRDSRYLDADEARALAVDEIDSNSTLASYLLNDLERGEVGVEEVLEVATRHIDSESTRATLLLRAVDSRRDDPGLKPAVIDALAYFGSRSTLATLLTGLESRGLLTDGEVRTIEREHGIKRTRPAEGALPVSRGGADDVTARRTLLAVSGGRMSDSERASRLLRVAQSNPHDPALPVVLDEQLGRIASNSTLASTLLELERMGAMTPERVREVALDSITSESTRASLLLDQYRRGSATSAEVLDGALTLSSESTRASLVIDVSRSTRLDPRTHDEVLEILPSFASNSTLASLLLSLDREELLETVEAVGIAAEQFESGSTLASYLRSIQRDHPDDTSVRRAVSEAYGAIESHSTLAEALGQALEDGYFDAVETLRVAGNGLREWDGISRSGRWENGVQIESYPDALEMFVARLAREHRFDHAFRQAYDDVAESMRTPEVRQRLLRYITD